MRARRVVSIVLALAAGAVGCGGESPMPAGPGGSTSPVTGDVTVVADSSAQLTGTFTNPAGFVTTTWFEYGQTPDFGSTTSSTTYVTTGSIQASATVTGLTPSTTYYYRLTTQNSDGTFAGERKAFTTLATPQELASGLNHAIELQLRGGELYWLEFYGGVVRKVSTAGGTVVEVGRKPGGGNAAWLVVDGTNAYWSDNSTIWKAPRTGGSLDTLITGRQFVGPLVVYGSDLYWREGSEAPDFWGIMKIDTAGGAVDTLVSGGNLSVGALVVDATGMYWTDIWGGTISRRALSGGPTVVLAMGLTQPHQLIHEDGMLFWLELNRVRKMPDTGGAIITIFSGEQPLGLAKDATHVYWADGPFGDYALRQIRKAILSGGTSTTLAAQQRRALGLVVDATSVYWIVGGDTPNPPLGAIRKVPK